MADGSRYLAILAIFLFLQVSLIPSTKAQQNDYLIVPGERVGRFELGKRIDAYGFGQPGSRWDGKTSDGRVYYDGYSVRVEPEGLSIQVFTCRSDGLTFAIIATRPVNRASEASEATKYRTTEGLQIGMDERDVLRLLGQPRSTGQWSERHGTVDVAVSAHNYPGLAVYVNRNDSKVFALGAVSSGGWPACQQAALGGPATAQQPSQTTPAYLARLASSVGVSFPSDVRIVAPGPQVPQDAARFSGAWFGRWEGILSHILVVEEISGDPSRVVAIYAYGNAPQWRISAAWGRHRGSISQGELRLDRFSNGAQAMYRMRSNDVLDGIYELQGQITRGTFQRVRE